jgi:hypothetical protein
VLRDSSCCHVKWLSEGWYICHNKQMQLWHVTFATLAAGTVTMLYYENKRRDRATGGPIGLHTIDEDLTDKQNEDFRYVL